MSQRADDLECETCEKSLLEAVDLAAALADPAIATHLAGCESCGDLAESLRGVKAGLDGYKVPEPSEALIQAVVARAHSPLPALAVDHGQPAWAPSRASLFRILSAGLLALPFVALVNLTTGWALYEVTIHLLPRAIALYCVGAFAAWASLAVSLGYATLPFMTLLERRFRVSPEPVAR